MDAHQHKTPSGKGSSVDVSHESALFDWLLQNFRSIRLVRVAGVIKKSWRAAGYTWIAILPSNTTVKQIAKFEVKFVDSDRADITVKFNAAVGYAPTRFKQANAKTKNPMNAHFYLRIEPVQGTDAFDFGNEDDCPTWREFTLSGNCDMSDEQKVIRGIAVKEQDAVAPKSTSQHRIGIPADIYYPPVSSCSNATAPILHPPASLSSPITSSFHNPAPFNPNGSNHASQTAIDAYPSNVPVVPAPNLTTFAQAPVPDPPLVLPSPASGIARRVDVSLEKENVSPPSSIMSKEEECQLEEKYTKQHYEKLEAMWQEYLKVERAKAEKEIEDRTWLKCKSDFLLKHPGFTIN